MGKGSHYIYIYIIYIYIYIYYIHIYILYTYIYIYMDVSKNRGGPPKWMVYNGNPSKMDDLGVPLCLETPIITHIYIYCNCS